MKTNYFLSLYQEMITQKGYKTDETQISVIKYLSQIYQKLSVNHYKINTINSSSYRLLNVLNKKLLNNSTLIMKKKPIKGLYIWGGVGRGKTWLMDLFYRSLPGSRKLIFHFHRFMLRVHESMIKLQGCKDPLKIIADELKDETDVICFDELFVSDITDAMLLGVLIKNIFDRGITLIATANTPPEDLYSNGLQRTLFLPTIELIKRHCTICNIGSGIDYRQRILTPANLWSIIQEHKIIDVEITRMINFLTGKYFKLAKHPVILEINYHQLKIIGTIDNLLVIDFSELCIASCSQNDYIAISKQFNSVLLCNVLTMGKDNENTARRFLALIDEFYYHNVKLFVIANIPIDKIYQGKLLKIEYQRCISRLQEMQSKEYLNLKHRL